jgi:surface antigen
LPRAGATLGRGTLLIGAALALAGCSINLPMSSLINEPESTGSIVPASPPMQMGLTDEDWARASVALDTALDPQQAGAPAKWANAETGRGGVFVAAGPAFIRNDQVCRAFKASLAQHPQDQRLFGTACRVGGGAWSLQKVKPLLEGA